ncbi:DUF2231 domain-containing protein [Kyrpidia sp.]|uniref:DUF2231 domain-containing protein n=1 Tax=Kyrpidia sp. TaxID=2073077 RepID=UPI002587738A|nr:DUF2231 domain-containing protein [Kyrpidia sp.]MCL6575661.1 hypothetical protein [Kyrpidia sp.]
MSGFLLDLFRHPHPIVVHFPIALIVVAAAYDLITVVRHREIPPGRGLLLWLVAAAGAALAVATGPEHDARGISASFEPHERLADVTLILALIVAAWRLWAAWRRQLVKGPVRKAAYTVLSVAAAVAVLVTGYYGGHMVYEEAIGVSMNGNLIHPPIPGSHGEHD